MGVFPMWWGFLWDGVVYCLVALNVLSDGVRRFPSLSCTLFDDEGRGLCVDGYGLGLNVVWVSSGLSLSMGMTVGEYM